MDIFTAPSHHDVLVLVIQIAVLLFSARALGELAQRFGQPAVVGEIFAGLVLGPSLLSGLFPVVGEWIMPQTEVQGYLLETISLLGAMFLLIMTGLETDIPLIKKYSKTAVKIAVGGLSVTFTLGYIMASNLPDFLVAANDQRIVFNLFVATAMSITAIPVIAKVLMDLNLMRRNFGQTIMAVGMIDDTSAWIMLSIVLGMATTGVVTVTSVGFAAGKIIVFMIFTFTIGRWMVKKMLHFVQDKVISNDRILTFVVVVAFVWGAIAQSLGIEAVLGAFVTGIMFGTFPRMPIQVIHKLESVALGIFAPIFFAVAGLKVNIVALFDPTLALMAVLVISVAMVGKMGGAYLGSRIAGQDHWTSLAFGSAINARGAVEIIIASIGLSLGILTIDMYSIIVVMAVSTSIMAPFMLKIIIKRVQPDEEEKKRLEMEEMATKSSIASISRILIPVRVRDEVNISTQNLESLIINKLGTEISITLMTVETQENEDKADKFLAELAKQFSVGEVVTKNVIDKKPLDAIMDEVQKDYSLMILGATENTEDSDYVFNPMVDFLVRTSPCATLVVKSAGHDEHWKPEKIMVPSNGGKSAKAAADLAIALANKTDAEVIFVHVNLASTEYSITNQRTNLRLKQVKVARQFLRDLKNMADSFDVKSSTVMLEGSSVEAEICNFAQNNGINLITLGTGLRPGTDRLFFGPRVETIISSAKSPVLVFNT